MPRVRSLAGLSVAIVTLLGVAAFGLSRGAAQGEQPGGLVPHPAHIHRGTCSNLDPNPLYPLTNVSLGLETEGSPEVGDMVGAGGAFPAETSVTTVEASLDDLLAEPLAVNVHQSEEQIDTYIACGDIGGVRHGADLTFGLAPQSGSDYAGTVWLHDNGDGSTTVTIALVRNLVTAAVGTPAAGPAATPAAPAATPAGEEQAEPGTEVTVELIDINFQPKEFTIPAGADVTVHLTNTGAILHDFTIDALGIHEEVAPGTETTITIDAEAGDYDYICTQDAHKEAGMVGVMHVQ